jgi:hypothetical protein
MSNSRTILAALPGIAVVIAAGAIVAFAAQQPQQTASEVPSLQADGTLAFPSNYREWIFLCSGLGMTYGPNAPAPGQPQSFTNVYVNPASYRAFMKTGAWPDRTMFVLEIRGSASEGSINKSGHFQTGVRAIEVNLKDQQLQGGWGFYNFGRETAAVRALPQTAQCYSCHAENTAVEHTFVQFYPSLMDVARKMGTVKSTYKE